MYIIRDMASNAFGNGISSGVLQVTPMLNGGDVLSVSRAERRTRTVFIASGEREIEGEVSFDVHRPRHEKPKSYHWDFPSEERTLVGRELPTNGQVRPGVAITETWGTGHISVSLYPLECGRGIPNLSGNGVGKPLSESQHGSSAMEKR